MRYTRQEVFIDCERILRHFFLQICKKCPHFEETALKILIVAKAGLKANGFLKYCPEYKAKVTIKLA